MRTCVYLLVNVPLEVYSLHYRVCGISLLPMFLVSNNIQFLVFRVESLSESVSCAKLSIAASPCLPVFKNEFSFVFLHLAFGGKNSWNFCEYFFVNFRFIIFFPRQNIFEQVNIKKWYNKNKYNFKAVQNNNE